MDDVLINSGGDVSRGRGRAMAQYIFTRLCGTQNVFDLTVNAETTVICDHGCRRWSTTLDFRMSQQRHSAAPDRSQRRDLRADRRCF